ncbi:MAG: hypothetical protein IT531_10235 [Burkholderiales bacterium]|nr:hypothetical protein [Burkholderiales bacterium]
MRTIEVFRGSSNESNMPAAFMNGFADGQTARANNDALTAYLRVGIDDYAKGFRAGFFARANSSRVAERPVRRNVVNL